MGSNVHRAAIGIASCHRPLGGQCFDLSHRPPGAQDLFANLTQLRVCSHAQSPSRPAQRVEISGGGGSGFDDHEVVVPADIDDCDPGIRKGCSALERERCAEQLRVVRHEPVEVGRGESQMVDSEEIGHGQPTVVQPLVGTWVLRPPRAATPLPRCGAAPTSGFINISSPWQQPSLASGFVPCRARPHSKGEIKQCRWLAGRHGLLGPWP